MGGEKPYELCCRSDNPNHVFCLRFFFFSLRVRFFFSWGFHFRNVYYILTGVGTMIVGFIKCSCESFFVGLLQMLITVLFIGWVWSIWWGWDLMKISRQTVQIPNDVGRDLLPVDAGQA